MPKFFSSRKKIATLLLLIFVISGSVFLFPQNAFGQGVTVDVPKVVQNIEKPIEKAAKKTYKQMAATAFKTALGTFLNKVAYDMAVAVATGAPGQKSLIFDDPNYFLNLGDAVMGSAVDEIAQGSGFTNMLGTTSLCQPIDLTAKVNLLLSFKKPAEPKKPRCSLSQMSKSLAESANSFTNSFSLANLSLRFEMGDLEEARNSLRKALTVEKYLDIHSAIYSNLNSVLTDLEKASDDLSGLIQRIYQKPIGERQAAADGELKNLSEVQTQLILNQNKISQIQEMINNCGSESGNCTEMGAVGVCQIFIDNPLQMNCSAAVSAAQTYHSQFQKLENDLTDGMNNLYTGILEKAFTVPDASDPKDIGNAFNREANDLGKFSIIKETNDNNVNVKIENEKLLQRISKDCEPKKDPVSGMNVLPASAACGMFNFAMSKSTVNEETYTGIFSQALSIFTNTLAGKLMQNWFEKGVAALFDKGKGKNSTSASDLAAGNLPRGKAAAEERFLTLLQSNFTAGGPFEVLRELTTCPEQGAGPNNCIVDSDFSQAIAERLTLKEAMDKKLLDPKRPFGYLKSGGVGGILVEPSYLNGYPYRSMIVLRKFRIIPVGWELAAEWIRDPGKNTNKTPYTLKQVVDCYEDTSDCVFNANNGVPNPFYHLVDPGWVLLEQPAFCKRQGAGEKILAEEFLCSKPSMTGFCSKDKALKCDATDSTACVNGTKGDCEIEGCLEYSRNVFRQEYCADEQTCLAKNDDGSCRFYGYCSEDTPSWKLDGSSCRQEYNSCQTYSNKDGANVSYLEHTISSGGCNSGNADCQWYCEEAPLVCSGGSKNGEPCSGNNDCAPTAGGIVDGVCRPSDLWKCQGKNLISNPGIEVNRNDWSDILGSSSNNRVNTGHESFASLSSQSSGAESGFQSNSVFFFKGESIDASGWVNVSAAGSGVSIRLRNLTSGTTIAESEIINELNIWKPVHLAASISADANIALELVAYNNATAMFDDIALFRGDRISFDKDVKQCEAKDAGCHEFARTINGANLIFNPSFEIEEKNFSEAPIAGSGWYGWHLPEGETAPTNVSRETSIIKSGKASLKIENSTGVTVAVGLETADPRNKNAADYDEHKYLPEESYTVSVYAKAQADCVGDCLELVGDCRGDDPSLGTNARTFSLTSQWEKYSFNFNYKKDKSIAYDDDYCRFFTRFKENNTYWLDDAKLEIGSQSTNYKDYGGEKIYLNESRISCDLSEVGCELYTPVDGDVGIPAVAKIGDRCPAECVGYETYHEIPSYFDPIEDAAADVIFPNFIPPTAVQCSAQAAGCEEFTNLDTVASGGEAKEYYTYIRQCAKPGTTTEATYYTWEGSEEAGFQLRAWKFKAYADGSPYTIDGTLTCDLANPDCRIFYTQSGTAFQRFLSKTVFISNDCQPLRRTIEGSRDDCLGNVGLGIAGSGGYQWDDPDNDGQGICYYNVIPSQGLKCEPKYANCREYKGPSANSQQSLFKSNFEDLLVDNWIGGALASESVSVGGNSFKISGTPADALRDVSSIVQKNKTYLLKFWAKPVNSGTTILTRFNNGSSNIDFGQAPLSDDWNSYMFGPGDFTTRDPGTVENLVIRGSDNFYIDNIEFIEAGDDSFVIKDSWKTPASCDLDPQGNISSGYALHCSAYTDRAKSTHNLKSFSKLCREDHVGCELLADTQNTQNYFSEWKSGEYAPADILTPIVNDDKKYCDGKFKGCQKFGRPEVDAGDSVTSWNSAYLINNPDNYKEILCQNTENWCKEYKTPDGAEKYFKDPGQKICEYKEDIGVGNTVASGWFIKGQYEKINPSECAGAMRHCSIDRNGSFLFCRQDSDCQPIGKNGLPENLGICIAKDTEWVRECPETQSSCTEYIDPLFSQTQGVKDRYYYLSDTIDEGKCKGIIDEDQKCVAFNNSEKPIMNVRASGTCKADSSKYCTVNGDCPAQTGNSDDICLMKSDKPFDPQACVRCSADQLSCNPDPTKPNPCCSAVTAASQIACNANTILYVQKDRDCREWLSCVSSAKITNGKGEKENVCYDVARCTRIDPVTGTCLEQAKDVNYCEATLPGADCDLGTKTCVSEPSRSCEKDSECAKLCSSDAHCMENIGPCDLGINKCKNDGARTCTKDYECFNDQGPCIADSQTFDSPKIVAVPPHQGAVDDLRYRSGFNPYGIHWTSLAQTREGEYLPTTTMQKGQVILLEDGDFEKQQSVWRVPQECKVSTVACVDDSVCLSTNTCDLGSGKCRIVGNVCSSDAQCDTDRDLTDVCQTTADINYERIKVLSGLQALKLGLNEKVYQGNYLKAENYSTASPPIKVAGNSQISMSGYLNTLDLKNNEAQVVIEEFNVNAVKFTDFLFPPTVVIEQAAGKPWKFYAGIFTTKPETVSIRVSLKNNGNGFAYFDNFLMLPVLNYQNQSYQVPFLEVYDSSRVSSGSVSPPGENPFIGRSCRLYPQTNAPACFYTNEQKQQFQGWRGFCIEPDPNNPLHCLQWLPIEQLQGEAGLGFKTETSYSGKTPLYYCAEASLWQLRCNTFENWTQNMWNGYTKDECPGRGNYKESGFDLGFASGNAKWGYSYDKSCKDIYYKGYEQKWSYGFIFVKEFGRAWCQVKGYGGGKDNDCVWIPYSPCPYGDKDIAKDISPNLIARCDKLVEVVDAEGKNIAWTNRMDQQSFIAGTPFGYKYASDQNASPYGSILAYGQADQTPDKWQTTFGKDFINSGGMVRSNTTIIKSSGVAPEKYPLWIVPKSEDVMRCSNDSSKPCVNDSQCGAGTCITDNAMACALSSGGSPYACTSPYCYNDAPAAQSNSLQCNPPTDTSGSFAMSIPQLVRPGTPSAAQKANTNNENFKDGVKRLQHLYAKSYSAWVWNEEAQCAAGDVSSLCSGICVGGASAGASCSYDSHCPGGACNINEITGNQCDIDADCNISNSECTPVGGGVCANPAVSTEPWPNDKIVPYVNKKCDPTCMGGSCLPAKHCSVTTTKYCIDDTDCLVGEGTCVAAGDQCKIGGVFNGTACVPANNCSTLSGNAGCPGNAFCDPVGNLCVGGADNGNNCDTNADCSGTASCDGGGNCLGGVRHGQSCDYTPICTASVCKDGAGNIYNYCISDDNCMDVDGNPTTCQPMGAGVQMCVRGGFSGSKICTKLDGPFANLAACAADCSLPGVCQLGPDAQYYCSNTANTIYGAPNCKASIECQKEYSCDYSYGMKSCLADADCSGTSSVDTCSPYNKCALKKDAGSGAVTGFEKLGEDCKNNADCDGAGTDDGICTLQWCDVGASANIACSNNTDCNNLKNIYGNPAGSYQYVNVAKTGLGFNMTYQDALWEPRDNQCSGNQRPNVTQPPNKDIIKETGEMCGVAPEIKFINKPGDGSLPSDIKIDAGNSVTINFLTMIDAEQRPIRQIIVDWGDPLLGQSSVGPYSDGTGLSPKTLNTDPFTFTSSPYADAGIYTITVMVQDNWNWCNGTANGLGNYGSNCSCLKPGDFCINWLPFPGKIIVK